MGKYNVKEVMRAAHRFYKSRARTGQTWSEVLEMSWLWEKNRVRSREERDAKAIEMLKNYQPSGGSDYNDLTIPASAFYNPNSKGLMGAHYVGD